MRLKGTTMSLDDTMIARFVLLCVIIVFHAGFVYGFAFPDIGHLCVAGFFFMSGYGLELSLRRKRSYMRDFLQKRVLGLMLQYWVIMIVCAVASAVAYLNPAALLNDIPAAFLSAPHWYVTELVVFYLLFYLTANVSTSRGGDAPRLIVLASAVLVSMVMMYGHFDTSLYYRSGAAFILGVVWYTLIPRIESFVRSHGYAVLAAASVALVLVPPFSSSMPADFMLTSFGGFSFCVLLWMMCSVDSRVSTVAMTVISLFVLAGVSVAGIPDEGAAMLLMVSVCGLLCSSGPHRRACIIMGSMSFELYLMHYMTFGFYFPGRIDDPVPAFALSMVTTLVLCLVTYEINRRVVRWNLALSDRYSDASCHNNEESH